jgi:short-subunit dehydrogenase/MoaA/NifB/PqqE/SkfB family radical SAM enzyme
MDRSAFAGKNVIVTGASGGLGSALCKRLVDRGANLVVTSRSSAALEELIGRFQESLSRFEIITADLSLPGEAKRLARESVEKMGRIDALFNNAGIGYFALMEEATEENVRRLFELNTFSPLGLIKELIPHMKERGGGRFINIVSAAGRVPIPTVGVYGGSKSALAVMTNTMRLELAPFGIDVVNIYPGTIDSSFEENALREGDRSGLCPTDRCGLPRDEMADQVMAAAEGPPGEIWLERPGKWLSVASILFPGYVDNKLASIRDRVVETKSLKQRPYRLLQVESALACNLDCVMCPWTEIRRNLENKGVMSLEIWEAIKPQLKKVKSVDFTGGGEPLLQPHLAKWMADAKSAGCETGILTNGLLLTEKKATELIQAGWDWLCVSMDGATEEKYEQIRQGSNFTKVCENLGRISDLRRGGKPKTMINFVLMNINFDQVEGIVKLAKELKVDQVNFKQCDVIRGERGKGFGLFQSEETRELRRMRKALDKAITLANKLGVKTTSFPFTPKQKPVCDQDPRDSMFIRFNGEVAPCINLAIGGPTTFLGEDVTMPAIHYGNIREESLEQLWETEPCRHYRERFQARVNAYERAYVQGLTSGATPGGDRLKQTALDAMPQAAEGCRVCHYLYDL